VARPANAHLVIKQVGARPEFTSALDQLKPPQPPQGVVQTATIRFIACSRGDLFLIQRGGIGLRESLYGESPCLSQPAPPLIYESAIGGQRLPRAQISDSCVGDHEPIPVALDQSSRAKSPEKAVETAATGGVAGPHRHLHLAPALRILGQAGQDSAFPRRDFKRSIQVLG
jgi:hypothetical protein